MFPKTPQNKFCPSTHPSASVSPREYPGADVNREPTTLFKKKMKIPPTREPTTTKNCPRLNWAVEKAALYLTALQRWQRSSQLKILLGEIRANISCVTQYRARLTLEPCDPAGSICVVPVTAGKASVSV